MIGMTWGDDIRKAKKRTALDLNKVRGRMAEDVFVAGRTVHGYELGEQEEAAISKKGKWTFSQEAKVLEPLLR